MDDLQTQLLLEQFNHLKENIDSRFQRIEKELSHHAQLDAERDKLIWSNLEGIRKAMEDHEQRIRKIDDSVISNQTTTSLFQAGQAALTLIAAAIAAWLGAKA